MVSGGNLQSHCKPCLSIPYSRLPQWSQ